MTLPLQQFVSPHVAIAGYTNLQNRQCAHNVTLRFILAKLFAVKKHKRHGIRKKDINHKMCFSNFFTVLSKTFFILRRTERSVIKKYIVNTYSTRYFYQILITLEFSGQIFEKYLHIKFHENPSIGSRVVPCGRTDGWKDRRTDNSRFS